MHTLIILGAFAVLQPVAPPEDNPGALAAYEYVPADLEEGAPLVVVLHACEQFAREVDTETGWAEVADTLGFALLFPEQRFGNNQFLCFNWFIPGDIQRDRGENASIVAMVDDTLIRHRLDANRVFVTGLSAGAAMAQVLLANYPDRFRGGALIAGVPFGCGTTVVTAFDCLEDPGDRDWGALLPETDEPWPAVSIWHGTADPVVAPQNANALVTQWLSAHGIADDAIPETTAGVERRRWGNGLVEQVVITGMTHGTPVDTAGGCGEPDVFTRDVGVCAAQEIAEFFALDETPSTAPRIIEPVAEPIEEPVEQTPSEGCAGALPVVLFLVRRRRAKTRARR